MFGLRFAELSLATFLTLIVASLVFMQMNSPPSDSLLQRSTVTQKRATVMTGWGACCTGAFCWGEMTQAQCSAFSGTAFKDGELCSGCDVDSTGNTTSSASRVTCCGQQQGDCADMPLSDCDTSDNTHPEGQCTLCVYNQSSSSSSAPTGACCSAVDLSCLNDSTTEESCSAIQGGAYFFAGQTCTQVGCAGGVTASSSSSSASSLLISCCFWENCFDDMELDDCIDWSGSPLPENNLCLITGCGGLQSSPSSSSSSSGPETVCTDYLDNDSDGLIDCEDDDCEDDPACIVTSSASSSTPSGVCCNYIGGTCSLTLGSLWCTILFGHYYPDSTCSVCQAASSSSANLSSSAEASSAEAASSSAEASSAKAASSSAESNSACCLIDGSCFDLVPDYCSFVGGDPVQGYLCAAYDCTQPPSSSSANLSSSSAEASSAEAASSSAEDQSSSIDMQNQSSSASGASSSPAEKGNCCIEGEAFGLCFAQITRSVCENTLIGGIYLGQYPCIQAPTNGYNCGPTGTDGSSSADHASSQESSSSSGDCGNTILQTVLGEECDEGPQNSDAANAVCRSDCRFSRCGDGILDNAPTGREKETCDDGVLNSDAQTASCRTDCKSRNVFYTIGNWVGDLKLYSVNGIRVPDAPAVLPSVPLITIGLLALLLL